MNYKSTIDNHNNIIENNNITIDNLISNISNLPTFNDVNVLNEDVLEGKTFYANGMKRTGTMINVGQQIIYPADYIQNISKGYHDGTGYVEVGLNTNDANAQPINIKQGVIAYTNIGKITGTLPVLTYPVNPNNPGDYNYQFIAANNTLKQVTRAGVNYILGEYQIASSSQPDSWMFEGNRKMKMGFRESYIANLVKLTPNKLKLGETILGIEGNLEPDKPDQVKTVDPTLNIQNIVPDTGYELSQVTINAVTSAIDPNILPNNIKNGVNILGVVGNLSEGIDTSDATAKASDIAMNMTAYVNNQKITGNIQTFDNNYFSAAYDGITNKANTYYIKSINFSSPILFRNNAYMEIQIPKQTIAQYENLTPDKLKNRVNILGVVGNLIELNGTNLDITPSTLTQSFTPQSPYNGYNIVNISAVDASIDSNIVSENIKSGVTILNINGKSSVVDTEDATALISDITRGKTAYINGQLITGNLPEITGTGILGYGRVIQNNEYLEISSNIQANMILRQNAIVVHSTSIANVASAINLTANKLLVGYNILNIDGTATSDANALASDITISKTAYVNGVKLTGTSTAQADKEALEQTLEDLRQELAAITDADDAEKELNEIIQNLEDEILQLKTDKATLQGQVTSLQNQLDSIETQLDLLNNEQE